MTFKWVGGLTIAPPGGPAQLPWGPPGGGATPVQSAPEGGWLLACGLGLP